MADIAPGDKGIRFGQLTTTGRVGDKDKHSHVSVEVSCKHNNTEFVDWENLVRGHTQTCKKWGQCFQQRYIERERRWYETLAYGEL